ncbi:hypothetical protein CKO29_06125 [Allochromatium vinosum]|nr:hypothetical protein [Allochromatium vinosum]
MCLADSGKRLLLTFTLFVASFQKSLNDNWQTSKDKSTFSVIEFTNPLDQRSTGFTQIDRQVTIFNKVSGPSNSKKFLDIEMRRKYGKIHTPFFQQYIHGCF